MYPAHWHNAGNSRPDWRRTPRGLGADDRPLQAMQNLGEASHLLNVGPHLVYVSQMPGLAVRLKRLLLDEINRHWHAARSWREGVARVLDLPSAQ